MVDQFTRNGVLWGVPQLTDAGIAVYFNADLLDAAGVDLARAAGRLRWSPTAPSDTLRPLLARLTVDADGNRADTARIRCRPSPAVGLQRRQRPAGHLPELHRLGGRRVPGRRPVRLRQPRGRRRHSSTWSRLINDDHVAPPASDTNDNGDFSRNQFLQGRMALFQSGTYNLAADRRPGARSAGAWRCCPTGPAGRVSVTNGIAAAGNSATRHPDAVRAGAGLDGQRARQRSTSAPTAPPSPRCSRPSPCTSTTGRAAASTSARSSRCSTARASPRPAAPGSPPGYQALKPYFDEMFLGRRDVADHAWPTRRPRRTPRPQR